MNHHFHKLATKQKQRQGMHHHVHKLATKQKTNRQKHEHKNRPKNTQKDKNERMRVSYKTEGIGFEEEKEKVVPNMSA